MSKKHRNVPKPAPWDPESGERPLLGAADESVVDAPSRQTVLLLGILCASTLVMWAAGRAACNYHVPGEGLTPRVVSLEDKAKDPKGVAVELAQALSGADFETAEKLVSASGKSLVLDAKKKCGDCAQARAARESLLSVPEVISTSRTEAYVAVKTLGGPGGEETRVFHLERAAKGDIPWQATGLMSGRDAIPPLDGALPPRGTPTSSSLRRGATPVPLRPGHPPIAPGQMPADATHRAVAADAQPATGTSPGSSQPPAATGKKAASPAPNAPGPGPAKPAPAQPAPAQPAPAQPAPAQPAPAQPAP